MRLKAVGGSVFEPDDETLLEAYLVLINTLACLGKEDGWVLAEGIAEESWEHGGAVGGGFNGAERKRRRIVRLEDVRREYQSELDRRSEMQQGRFPLLGGDAMDVL